MGRPKQRKAALVSSSSQKKLLEKAEKKHGNLQARSGYEGGGGQADEANVLILPSGRDRKRKKASEEQKGVPKLNKKHARKLRRLQEEEEKKQKRIKALAILQECQLTDGALSLLHTSGRLGQEDTMKEKLKQAMQLQRAGLPVPTDVPLVQGRKCEAEDNKLVDHTDVDQRQKKRTESDKGGLGGDNLEQGPNVAPSLSLQPREAGLNNLMDMEGLGNGVSQFEPRKQTMMHAAPDGSKGKLTDNSILNEDGMSQEDSSRPKKKRKKARVGEIEISEELNDVALHLSEAAERGSPTASCLPNGKQITAKADSLSSEGLKFQKLVNEASNGKTADCQHDEAVLKEVTKSLDESQEQQHADVKGNLKSRQAGKEKEQNCNDELNSVNRELSLHMESGGEGGDQVARGQLAGGSKFWVHVNRTEAIESSRNGLPILSMEHEIMEAVNMSSVVIVCGETGCGKTTQVPQFLYEAGYGAKQCQERSGIIGVTQPRRVAVLATARRVAEELNVKLGQEVGFQVRYDRQIGAKGAVKFMTDGILLRELQADLLLRQYSVVVLDEAHERSINTDILLGLLSRVVPLRQKLYDDWLSKQQLKNSSEANTPKLGDFSGSQDPPITPLKLIIMSATLRVEDFVENKRMFPCPPPVVKVPARQFPVTVHFSRRTELVDYLGAAFKKVCAIHKQLPPGGVLVFLTGQGEVEALCRRLRRAFKKKRGTVSSGRRDGKGSTVIEGTAEAGMGKKGRHGDTIGASQTEEAAGDRKKDGGVGEIASELKGNEAGQADVDIDRLLEAMDGEGQVDGVAQSAQQWMYDIDEGDRDEEGVEDSEEELEDSEQEEDDWDNKQKEKSRMAVVKAGKRSSITQEDNSWKNLQSLTELAMGTGGTTLSVEEVTDEGPGPLYVLPLYAMLPAAEQLKVFRKVPENARLVVVATNVAETSVTIPGIRYVIDTGRAKEKIYDRASGVSKFEVHWISKASADQRAGRAGRTGPGHCYRLYSSALFNDTFQQYALPELLGAPIEGVVLQMKDMGIDKVVNFPFPTPPKRSALSEAEQCLQALSALDPISGSLTPVGRDMARYPVGPRHSRMLLAVLSSLDKVAKTTSLLVRPPLVLAFGLAVASALSLESPFLREGSNLEDSHIGGANTASDKEGLEEDKHDQKETNVVGDDLDEETMSDGRPKGNEEDEKVRRSQMRKAARAVHAAFKSPLSDAVTVAQVLRAYEKADDKELFCTNSFLHSKTMQEMAMLRRQLSRIVVKCNTSIQPQKTSLRHKENRVGFINESETVWLSQDQVTLKLTPQEEGIIRQAICAGWADRVAHKLSVQESASIEDNMRRKTARYRSCTLDEPTYLHPTSSVFRESPSWVVYCELVQTSRPYMRGVTAVSPEWLPIQAMSLCTFSKPLEDPPPWYDQSNDKVMCWVSPSFGPHLWSLPLHAVEMKSGKHCTAVFAMALLQGKVMDSFQQLHGILGSNPNTLVRPEAHSQKRIGELLHRLGEGKGLVNSRGKLLERWRNDSRFLFEEITLWVQTDQRKKLPSVWASLREEVKKRLSVG